MFNELNIVINYGLVAVLSLFTIWCCKRGLQNGILLLLVSALFPMHQVTLIWGIGGVLPNLTIDRVVSPLILLMFILQWRQGKINRYPPDLVEYNMFILLVVIFVNMYVHGTYKSKSILTGGVEKLQLYAVVSGFFLPFMSYFIMRRAILTNAQVQSFLTGVGLITIYLGVTGFGEAWHQSWLVYPKYILDIHEGTHFGRVRGPFVQASWDGVSMAMGLPILLWLFFGRRDASRGLWLLGIAAVGVSLPYVFQRAAWLSAAAALGMIALTWPKRGLTVLGAVLLVAALGGLMLPETLERQINWKLSESENIEFRLRIIDHTWKMIDNNFAMGVGMYQFDKELHKSGLGSVYGSHNTVLSIFAELGLFGFLPYFLIFSLLLFKSVKAYLLQPLSRMLVAGVWGIMAAYLIMSLAVEMRTLLYANVLLFAILGMLLAMKQSQSLFRQGRDAACPRVISFV